MKHIVVTAVMTLSVPAIAGVGHPFAGKPDEPSPPPSGPHAYISIGALTGVTTRDGGLFSSALRPELLFAPDALGGAIGVYVEGGTDTHDAFTGGGLTLNYYMHDFPLSIAPSIGAFHRFTATGETGYEASLFVGARVPYFYGESNWSDWAHGLRVDYRDDTHAHRELVFSLQGDLAFWTGLAANAL